MKQQYDVPLSRVLAHAITLQGAARRVRTIPGIYSPRRPRSFFLSSREALQANLTDVMLRYKIKRYGIKRGSQRDFEIKTRTRGCRKRLLLVRNR